MLVIFDWDGVIVDTVDKLLDCFKDSVKEVLPEEDAEKARAYFDEQKGRPLEIIAEELFGKEKAKILVEKHLEKEKKITSKNAAFLEVREIIEKLKAEGHTVAISTGFMHEEMWPRVVAAGLDDLLDEKLVVGFKPGFEKPDHVRHLLKQTGENYAVFFDDGLETVRRLKEKQIKALYVVHFGKGGEVENHAEIVDKVREVSRGISRK